MSDQLPSWLEPAEDDTYCPCGRRARWRLPGASKGAAGWCGLPNHLQTRTVDPGASSRDRSDDDEAPSGY